VYTAHYNMLVTSTVCCMYVVMCIVKFSVCVFYELIAIAVIMCDMNCTVKLDQRSEVKVVMHSSAQHKTKVVIQCSAQQKIKLVCLCIHVCLYTSQC
jgi:DMSO reductase anchor subunit